MFKRLCTIKTRLPRPQPAETIASIKLFLETLPQFMDSDLSLVLDETDSTYIHPTEEMKDEAWFATSSEARWDNGSSVADWAYKILENHTVMRFITQLQPMRTLKYGTIQEYFAFQHRHKYEATEQKMSTGVSIFLPGALTYSNAEIFQAKTSCMFSALNSLKTTSHPLFVWQNSFLEIGVNWPDELPALLAKIEQQSTPFVAMSTNGANHFGRIAAKVLQVTLPPRTTDAELLNQIVPWGRRTQLFKHTAKETGSKPGFFFCYIKPLREYPPIRLEIPAKVPLDEIDDHIDRTVAHIILNPNVL